MLVLESDNLNEVVSSNKKVFVQYGAGWCGICRMLKPRIEKLSKEHDSVTFVYVDAENFPESRQMAKVENLPTFAIFEDGKIVNQSFGSKIEAATTLIDEITNN